MPGFRHEALCHLFRSRPALAVELARDAGVPLPRGARTVRLHATDLGDVQPADRRADVVVVVGRRRAMAAIVLEVQLSRKRRKRFAWPAYLASLRAELRCDVFLVVVAPGAVVARWCAKPIAMGQPGWVLHPIVIGPASIPLVTSARDAARVPEIAVLSAVAHGGSARGDATAQAVLHALGAASLDEEALEMYSDLVLSSLGEAARLALEEKMRTREYQVKNRVLRELIARGRAEGEAKGRAEGEARGRAEAVLAVLQARGLRIPKRVRTTVARCTDPRRLDRWVRRAAMVPRAADLLG
jgi:hypothetical protein